MNVTMIEALYQRDLEAADDAHRDAVNRAEARKQKRLDELEEQRRANYRHEQQFFFQG